MMSLTQRGGKILIIDDEPFVNSPEFSSSQFDFIVASANSAEECLERIESETDPMNAVFLDLVFLEKNGGTALVNSIRNKFPNLYIAVIAAPELIDNAIISLHSDVCLFLEKPITRTELTLELERAEGCRAIHRELDAFRVDFDKLQRDNPHASEANGGPIDILLRETLKSIVAIMDHYEADTAAHSHRVSDCSLYLAKKIGVTDKGILKTIKYGALLHDIGKICIPKRILNKPSSLTEKESQVMGRHVEKGWSFFNSIPLLKDVAEIVYSHHERYDGNGYPRRLKAEEIAIGARIFSIIDTFDVMLFGRDYCSKKSHGKILDEINNCSGTQFDPDFVRVFNSCFDDLIQLHEPPSPYKSKSSSRLSMRTQRLKIIS